MKYLILTNHTYMLWQFRRELLAELLTRGEVLIAAPFTGHEEDFRAMGCRLLETKLDRRSVNPVKDLALFRHYRHILKAERPDVVLTYSIKPNVYGGFACSLAGIPCFVNVQGLGTAFQKQPLAAVATAMYAVGTHRAKLLFFENEANRGEFLRRRIVKKERTCLLSGAGVNLSFHTQQPYPEENGIIRFLYLGRIMKEKGVEELFAAARSLKKKYGDAVVFDFVGFFDDAYETEVNQLAEEGIAVFHGFQTDPRPFYAATHCVVQPSYHEGMNNVLVEGAATGRALITTRIPGCMEAVEDGVNGYLCNRMDTADLEAKMEAFLQLSSSERAAMGAAGRKKMEREFSRQTVVARILEKLPQE